MENMSKRQLFAAYIWYCKKYFINFGTVLIIFGLICFAYGLPTDAVAYGAGLCLCIFLPFALYDFYRFVKTHRELTELQKSIIIKIDSLPPANNLIAEDYRQLIEICFDDKMHCQGKWEETSKEITDYYTMWVHQIKTPIAAMGLLLQDSTDDELKADMCNELVKIEQYADMALNYIKIENSGESDFSFANQPLDNIVREAVRKYAKLFIRKKIALNYTSLNCTVLTDKKWLLFVIEQILSNSLKYTKSGTISIYMQNENSKCLVIEDTGIGIEDSDLPRIFDKGFTGYNGRQNSKSTGIGLYLCKNILHKIGHKIYAQSTVGSGTKIIIDLFSYDFSAE